MRRLPLLLIAGSLFAATGQAHADARGNTILVLYLNKNGGTYSPANENDSRTNASTIPQQASVIAPWNVSAAGWQQVVDCVKAEFAPFNIQVTDVDPGNVPHIESVIAGSPGDVQMPNNVGGVSPFTIDCQTIPNSIVYTFANIYGTNYQTVCEVAAQEIAHSFGLDHEYLASDPMTYLDYNGHKTFQNTSSQCGEYQARLCGLVDQGYASCRANQNSVALLTERIGAAGPADAVAPQVAISSPSNGATVHSGFAVAVSASDNVAVTKVELYIDGALVDTKTAAPYAFTAPTTLALGSHSIETRGYDTANMTNSTVTVQLAAGGGGNGTGGGNGSGGGGGSGSGDGTGGTDDGYITGGCAAGGGGSPMLLLGLAALGLVRRRRRA
ncbi:MAG: hypothetical protein K8W52_17520 [Deltaproteobacteria bacterium]|nr:hypothetical protein [Deltaproteobacteria bacterium]